MPALLRVAPEIPVLDLQASLEHYQRKLGFETAMVLPDGLYAIVERDGVALHLFAEESTKLRPVGVHIFTQGLDALHAELARRGASIAEGVVSRPWGARDFRVRDPSGNTLKFTEPKTDAPAGPQHA